MPTCFDAKALKNRSCQLEARPPRRRMSRCEAQSLLISKRTDRDDHSIIIRFLKDYPKSHWNAALLTNLGLEDRKTGWFLKAMDAWEKAWALGKNEQSTRGKVLMDRAVGELAELNARLGRREKVETILQETQNRPLIGVATEKITAAREGVWQMRHEPGNAFKCGPFALARIRASEGLDSAPEPKILADSRLIMECLWIRFGNYQTSSGWTIKWPETAWLRYNRAVGRQLESKSLRSTHSRRPRTVFDSRSTLAPIFG